MILPAAWSLPAKLVAAALLVLAGFVAGGRWRQAQWDAAELNRLRDQGRRAAANADRGIEASAAHEAERAMLTAALRKARDATSHALRAPISCPASGLLGDLVLPADALDGVRDAAGRAAGDPGAAGQPQPAVR